MHFHHVLRPNQSQFLVIFKFFVRVASLIANHFHKFHLRETPNWSTLNPSHLVLLLSNQLQLFIIFNFFL
jgi:hypothetical protein